MFPKRFAPSTSRRATRRAIVVAGCLAGVLAPGTAQAAPEVSVSPSLAADSVRVGDTATGQVTIRNFGQNDAGSVNVSDITLDPSCGGDSTSLGTCISDGVDKGVITLAPTASATSGACVPAPAFSVGPAESPDATGKMRFTPFPAGSSVGWTANGSTSCTVSFTYTVTRMPSHDTDPDQPGTQTNLVAYARLSWTQSPATKYDDPTAVSVTVQPDRPALAARGLPEAVQTGQQIYATGELTDGTGPTGDFEFKLFKGDLPCSGSPVQTYSTVAFNSFGIGQSPLFVVNEPGYYWWIVSYSGDDNNEAVDSACTNSTRVTAPAPPPPPPPPPPPAGPGDGGTGGTNPGDGGTTGGGGGTNDGGTGSRTPGTNVVPTRVRLDRFGLSRKTFARAPKATALAATAAKVTKKKRMPKGTTIKYTLSAPAVVTIRVERAIIGRRVGTKCVKTTKKNKSKRPCTRYVKATTLKRTHRSRGAKKVAFSGRAGRKALPAGNYRMRASAAAGAGTTSLTRTAKFKIVKR